MDQVTKVRKYLKREQWKSLIKECQSSGMTVTAWCELNGICEQTYYRDLKKIREELCQNLPVRIPSPEVCSCSVGNAGIGSKFSYGKEMDSFSCISDRKTETSNGHAEKVM